MALPAPRWANGEWIAATFRVITGFRPFMQRNGIPARARLIAFDHVCPGRVTR
jgi:hypothetical protein